MKGWVKLVELKDQALYYGTYFKFPAVYPFESTVVFLLCQSWEDSGDFPWNLVTITGYKAGARNPLQMLPKECLHKKGGLDVAWLIANWIHWVYPEADVNDVWVRVEPLQADEI